MKVVNYTLAVLSFAAMSQSFAQTHNVYDVDGYDRLTEYANGPISSSVIGSDVAHVLDVYLHPSKTINQCYSAHVYTERSGKFITQGHIRTVDIRGRIHQVTADIPTEYVTENKKLIVQCEDNTGKEYKVHVKVPSAPVINWNVTLEPTANSEFIKPRRSFPYHTEYKVNSTLRIENKTTDSYCQSNTQFSPDLGLFNGKGGASKFNSNVFVASTIVNQSDEPKPYLIHSLECQNSAGKTFAKKVFALTNPEEMELLYDAVYHH